MSLTPMHLQGLEAISDEVAARAREEFSETPEDLQLKLLDACGLSVDVLLHLREGEWGELREALLALHETTPDGEFDLLAEEVRLNLG